MNSSPHYTRHGVLLVLSGPSGTGKTTVYQTLLAHHAEVAFSVSCTTRPPRAGEVDGRDYHFLTPEQFEGRRRAGEFLEHANVHGNMYGTLRRQMEEAVAAGRDVLLDVDVQGARQIRRQISGSRLAECAVFVFCGPPSRAELEKRLRARGSDDEAVIQRRLHNAVAELAAWSEYDCILINDVLDQTVKELEAVLIAARCGTKLVQGKVWDDVN